MALLLDTSSTATITTGSTLALPALTDTNTNTVIAVMVAANSATVSSITNSGAALTWTRRGGSNSGGADIELWWAVSSAALSSLVITVHLSGATVYTAATAFVVSGANTSAPFDANGSLPATSAGTGGLTVSTTAANTMLLGFFRNSTTTHPTVGSGYTLIPGGDYTISQYKIVTSAQTSVAVAETTGSTDTNGVIVDAIVAASVLVTGWTTAGVGGTISGATNLVVTSAAGTTACVTSANSHATGKWYAEMTVTGAGIGTGASVVSPTVGITSSAANLFGFPGQQSATSDSVGFECVHQQETYYNQTQVQSGIAAGPLTTGQVISICVDADNHKVYFLTPQLITAFGASGWNGLATANPVTGVGGIVYSLSTPAHLVAFVASDATGPVVVTLNTGGSAFARTPPTGFAAWETWAAVAQSVHPTALASTAALGTILARRLLHPAAVASTAAVGFPTAQRLLHPTGFASTATIGAAHSSQGVRPAGRVSTATFGTPAAIKQRIYPAAVSSTLVIGHTAARVGGSLIGIPSGSHFGVPHFNQTLHPAGKATSFAFGATPTTRRTNRLNPSAIASTVHIGTMTRLDPKLNAVMAAFASYGIFLEPLVILNPTAFPGQLLSKLTLGTVKINQRVHPTGLASGAIVGTLGGANRTTLRPATIASTSSLGTLGGTKQRVHPLGLPSTVGLGAITQQIGGARRIFPAAIAPTTLLGTAAGHALQRVHPLGRPSTAAIGVLAGASRVKQSVRPSAPQVSTRIGRISIPGSSSLTLYQLLSRITPNVQLVEKPRVRANVFGDGYVQTTPDGLTAVERTMTLSWDYLEVSEADQLIQAFRNNVGQTLSFRAPRDASPRNWLATGWQRSAPNGNTDGMTATFEDRPYIGPPL